MHWTKHLLKYYPIVSKGKIEFREVKVQGRGGAEIRTGLFDSSARALKHYTCYRLCSLSVERGLKTSRLMADNMHSLYPGSDDDI